MKLSAIFVHKRSVAIFLSLVLLAVIALFLLLYLVYVPKKYSAYVSKYAVEYGLEEEFVYAVIRAESNFRADAISTAGARGVMQLMPSTAQFIAECIGEELKIDSPQDNIRMGVWYLSYLKDRFGGQTETLAAYNAGEGTVRLWLKDERYSSDGETLQNIPISETKLYVRRVKKFYNSYKFCY